MIDLIYIPLNKYDEVIEHFDGSITIPKHQKKRYLFSTNYKHGFIYFLNNLTGSLFRFDFQKKELIQICIDKRNILKNCVGIGLFKEKFITYNSRNKQLVLFSDKDNTLYIDFNEDANNLYADFPYIWISNREKNTVSKYRYENDDFRFIENFSIKGIGNTSLLVLNNEIFITDSEENLLRKYNHHGKLEYEAITPFIDPIGQIYFNDEHYILYGGLVNEVGYENRCWQEQKPFLHKINVEIKEEENYTTTYSNTFEVDFFYEENLFENLPQEYFPMTVRLALPFETDHQKVIDICPLAVEFNIINEHNNKFAEYKILSNYTQSIGYRAKLHLRSVKTIVKNKEIFKISDKDLLTDIEKQDLDCYNPFFRQFVLENICHYNKLLKLRNLIYDRMEYRKNISATNFVEVLKDGYGSCGDYASLMLILFHINNIACQSASGYKIPRFYNATSGIISVYFNHTWLEILDNNNRYLPLESSSDDKKYNQHFSEGQFLGIDWTHIKLYNGKAFPNLIKIISHPHVHPFDIFRKASVYTIIKREIL